MRRDHAHENEERHHRQAIGEHRFERRGAHDEGNPEETVDDGKADHADQSHRHGDRNPQENQAQGDQKAANSDQWCVHATPPSLSSIDVILPCLWWFTPSFIRRPHGLAAREEGHGRKRHCKEMFMRAPPPDR